MLEEIPEISKEVFDAHSRRLKSDEIYGEFIRETFEHLYIKNPPPFAIIEATAKHSKDPHAVVEIAYTILNLVGDQLALNKLRKTS